MITLRCPRCDSTRLTSLGRFDPPSNAISYECHACSAEVNIFADWPVGGEGFDMDDVEEGKLSAAALKGLRHWAADYQQAMNFGNIHLARKIKHTIDARLKRLGVKLPAAYKKLGLTKENVMSSAGMLAGYDEVDEAQSTKELTTAIETWLKAEALEAMKHRPKKVILATFKKYKVDSTSITTWLKYEMRYQGKPEVTAAQANAAWKKINWKKLERDLGLHKKAPREGAPPPSVNRDAALVMEARKTAKLGGKRVDYDELLSELLKLEVGSYMGDEEDPDNIVADMQRDKRGFAKDMQAEVKRQGGTWDVKAWDKAWRNADWDDIADEIG